MAKTILRTFLNHERIRCNMELPPLKVNEKMPILKKTKMSTGILDLDIIMEGGYQNPGNVMILGPNGMEKGVMGYQFIANTDKTNEHAVILTTDTKPGGIIEKIESYGMKIGDNVSYIDCYSATLGGREIPESNEKVTVVSGPGALNDISLAINEIIKKTRGKKLRIIFDSLSTLVLYNPKESIIKFLQVVGGRLKNADATVVYIVEEGVHEKQVISLLEHTMDEIYAITENAGKIEMRVPQISMPIPIKLGPSGIVLL